MCGIVGIVSPAPDTSEPETIAARMAEVLKHRGPDAQGLSRSAHVVLAHRRLAVVDLTDAATSAVMVKLNEQARVIGCPGDS